MRKGGAAHHSQYPARLLDMEPPMIAYSVASCPSLTEPDAAAHGARLEAAQQAEQAVIWQRVAARLQAELNDSLARERELRAACTRGAESIGRLLAQIDDLETERRALNADLDQADADGEVSSREIAALRYSVTSSQRTQAVQAAVIQ